MSEIRRLSKKSRWYLPQEARITAIHYARQYTEWKNEYAVLGGIPAINISDMPRGQSIAASTERDGIRAAELKEKIRLIEDTVSETSTELFRWVLIGVTQKVSYAYLKTNLKIPCGERQYYEKKREFYYRLSKKI